MNGANYPHLATNSTRNSWGKCAFDVCNPDLNGNAHIGDNFHREFPYGEDYG